MEKIFVSTLLESVRIRPAREENKHCEYNKPIHETNKKTMLSNYD